VVRKDGRLFMTDLSDVGNFVSKNTKALLDILLPSQFLTIALDRNL